MGKITAGLTMSLDGFVAGPNQRFDSPFGDIDEDILHRWMFDEADQPEHKAEMLNFLVDAGTFIMGSNMFVPKDKYNVACDQLPKQLLSSRWFCYHVRRIKFHELSGYLAS